MNNHRNNIESAVDRLLAESLDISDPRVLKMLKNINVEPENAQQQADNLEAINMARGYLSKYGMSDLLDAYDEVNPYDEADEEFLRSMIAEPTVEYLYHASYNPIKGVIRAGSENGGAMNANFEGMVYLHESSKFLPTMFKEAKPLYIARVKTNAIDKTRIFPDPEQYTCSLADSSCNIWMHLGEVSEFDVEVYDTPDQAKY